jgi:hypothetical protein
MTRQQEVAQRKREQKAQQKLKKQVNIAKSSNV